MEEVLYYTELFDFYGTLLTEKQQNYFKDYYFNNLSLSEIAENYEITRNAIHNQLREAKEKLEYYEKNLQSIGRTCSCGSHVHICNSSNSRRN